MKMLKLLDLFLLEIYLLETLTSSSRECSR
jgi:hypothetical protein